MVYHDSGSRSSRIAARPTPECSISSSVRSTARSLTARAARRIWLAIPERPGGAVADDRDPAQAEQDRAAGRVRIHVLAKAAEGRAQQQRRRPLLAGPIGPRTRTAPATALAVPSIVFSTTLPVKPSVTSTSTLGIEQLAALDVAGEARSRSAAASDSCASTTTALPFLASSPTDSRATRGRSNPSTASAKAEPR